MDIPHLHKFAGGSSYILDGAWSHFHRRFDTFWSAFALRSEGILKPRLVKLREDEHQWIPGVKTWIPRFWSHLRWRELMFIGSIFFFNPFKATPFWDMLDLMYRLIFETYWSKSGDGGDGQAYSGPWEWGQVWLHKVRGELRLLRDLFSLGDVIQVDIDKAGPPSCSSSGHRILPRQQYPTIITWSIKTSQPYPKCFRIYSKQRYGRSLRRSQALSLLHVADNLERAIDSVKTDQLDESEARGLRSWGYSWNIR